MSELELAFYKKLKNLNWTFIIIQIIIFIFFIGFTYNRLVTIEDSDNAQNQKIYDLERLNNTKADKTELEVTKMELRGNIKDMRDDIKLDLREIRTLLESHIQQTK